MKLKKRKKQNTRILVEVHLASHSRVLLIGDVRIIGICYTHEKQTHYNSLAVNNAYIQSTHSLPIRMHNVNYTRFIWFSFLLRYKHKYKLYMIMLMTNDTTQFTANRYH